MDFEVDDIFEFQAGKFTVKILITYINEDISGKTLDNNPTLGLKGRFVTFTQRTFKLMISDGVLKKVGQRAKGISYSI